MRTRNPEFKPSVIIACLAVMLSIGIVYLWSVFQQPVIDHYGWEPSAVSMISSAMIFMYVLGSLIGGFIQDHLSPRFVIITGAALFFVGLFSTSLLGPRYPWLIYITYGAVAGSGVGFAYSAALSCIQKWLPHRRGFATGISVCAFGLSAVVFAPLIEWLLKLPAFAGNNVPMTFRTLACTFSVIIALAGFFVKNPCQNYLDSLNLPKAQVRQRQYAPREAVKTVEFWSLALSLFFLPAAYMIIIPLVKTLAIARGISEMQATLTVSLTGIASAASRLISSTASDKIGRAKTIWILSLLTAISALLMIFAKGWLYTVVVLLIVAGYSGPAGIFPAMSTDSFGTKYSGTNYGMAFMFLGTSSLVFTKLSTVINADGAVTGDYTMSFIIAAVGCIVPLVMLPLYDVAKKKRVPRDMALLAAEDKTAQQ